VAETLTVVVVAYDMARELPRTLRSLAPDYQRGIDAADYEVVVVDNGSPSPVDPAAIDAFPGRLRYMRVDPAPPSPARAANMGIAAATGDLVGLVVDGARLASPGLLGLARLGASLHPRAVVTTHGWHIGPVRHMDAADAGYDQATEDALLASVDWAADGYRLFDIATMAGSSGRGWFAPMGESSALFMRKALWHELGGLDESFSMPGGGLVNHDLFARACSAPGVQLVVLLGEGTFHQIHGGAATSRRFTWDEMHADYEAKRKSKYRPPRNEPLYVGRVPPSVLPHIGASAQRALDLRAKLS